jgi:hypothetical protein
MWRYNIIFGEVCNAKKGELHTTERGNGRRVPARMNWVGEAVQVSRERKGESLSEEKKKEWET